jgi:hypothetical protein
MSKILAEVNYLSVVIAGVAAWLFGAVYYTLLGKPWMAAQGKTAEQCKVEMAGKSGPAKAAPFILAFAATLLMAFVLFGILTHSGLWSVRAGMISGAFCWAGFVLTTVTVNNAFSGRRPMLTVIDSLHWLGCLLIIGAIVGGLGR